MMLSSTFVLMVATLILFINYVILKKSRWYLSVSNRGTVFFHVLFMMILACVMIVLGIDAEKENEIVFSVIYYFFSLIYLYVFLVIVKISQKLK